MLRLRFKAGGNPGGPKLFDGGLGFGDGVGSAKVSGICGIGSCCPCGVSGSGAFNVAIRRLLTSSNVAFGAGMREPGNICKFPRLPSLRMRLRIKFVEEENWDMYGGRVVGIDGDAALLISVPGPPARQ
jgi:hypothetical protein